jgi:hypothetical protein
MDNPNDSPTEQDRRQDEIRHNRVGQGARMPEEGRGSEALPGCQKGEFGKERRRNKKRNSTPPNSPLRDRPRRT